MLSTFHAQLVVRAVAAHRQRHGEDELIEVHFARSFHRRER
jgi:hypothetical protein